jgi:hypothetical protein
MTASITNHGLSPVKSTGDKERNHRGLPGNPNGFGTTKFRKHLLDDTSNYGSVERLKVIVSKPVSNVCKNADDSGPATGRRSATGPFGVG